MISLRTAGIVLAASLAATFTHVPYAASASVPCAAPGECRAAPVKLPMKPKGGAGKDIERIIAVEQLPGVVYATLMRLGKGIRIQEITENIDAGHATYEIDLVQDNVYLEVTIDALGTLLGREIEAWIVSLKSLPEPARKAVALEVGDGSILEVRQEYEEDNGEYVYEATLQKDGRTYALRIDALGDLIERDITLAMLPPGAYQALMDAAKGGSIVELDEEMHNGQLSYEANIVIGSTEFELSVDAGGNVVELNL